MPGTEHNHPEYEQTFTRIATILDAVAEERLATERTLRESVTQGKETRPALGNETRPALGNETWSALDEYIAQGKLHNAETTRKLNALIQLMDRRLRESGHQ